MNVELTDSLLSAVRESGLLDPAMVAELSAWAAATGADPPQVVKELRRRAWLGDFQIKEIARGRGKELYLGPYILVDLLGEGGMGRVYKAHHTRLGRDVALKVIRKEKLTRPSVVQRFHQEIRAAAQLSHPNVVLAFDADQADGIHYFSMEYVEGTDLSKLVRDVGPLSVAAACDYARQAALGLQHAHERGLVHRDVKPSNLLLTPRGQVKLLDLGLAMLNDTGSDPAEHRVTQTGLVLGTPDFLAPEQAQNPTLVDIRADVYGLGSTLYFLLTGRVPYEGNSSTEKLIQHVTAPPPSVSAVRPDVPPQLDALVQWFMAKDPAGRPQTPAHAAYALQPFCPTPAGTRSGGLPVPQTDRLPAPPPTDVAPAGFDFAGPLIHDTDPGDPKRPPAGSAARRAVVIVAVMSAVGLAAVGVVSAGRPRQPAAPPPPEGGGAADFVNAAGMKLVRLPGGTYRRGAAAGEPGARPEDGPPTPTAVGPFYAAATETTGGQFKRVMGRTPAQWAARLRNADAAPVEGVTWAEAAEFCVKLTSTPDPARPPGTAYRLPSEAEWEYACRAGTTTPFSPGSKLVYGTTAIFDIAATLAAASPLGEDDPTKGRLERGLPYPAGSTAANPSGLADLHGNVWEWCRDVYQPGLTTPPVGAAPGAFRSARGGSFREPAANCRSASRKGLAPDTRADDVGFRVVLAEEGR